MRLKKIFHENGASSQKKSFEDLESCMERYIQHKKKISHHCLPQATQISSKECPHLITVIKFPLTTKLVMNIEDNTLVFIVDVKTNKHQIKRFVKKLYNMAKIKTLIRLDGEQVNIQLASDYDALDINKIQTCIPILIKSIP